MKTYQDILKERFKEQIIRTASMDDELIQWKLVNPAVTDDKRNIKMIEDIAWPEMSKLKKKGLIRYHDDDIDVSKISKIGGVEPEYFVELWLKRGYDAQNLPKALKKLGFKLVKKI